MGILHYLSKGLTYALFSGRGLNFKIVPFSGTNVFTFDINPESARQRFVTFFKIKVNILILKKFSNGILYLFMPRIYEYLARRCRPDV